MHTHIHRVQKLKCIVLSHACKHKPDFHIMPYWSDRVSRKLAENTNTAWGGSLKLETSLLSMVFSSSGNHLVAHAYQVLLVYTLPSSGCLLQCLCDGGFKTHTHTHNLNCELSCLTSAFWLFCRDAARLSPPQPTAGATIFVSALVWEYAYHSAVWRGYGGRVFTGTDTTLF